MTPTQQTPSAAPALAPVPLAVGLQQRLLILLLAPLFLLAGINTWFDFRSADSAALQQDRHLASLVPLLAASVVAPGAALDDPPVLLMAPPVGDFLNDRPGLSAYAVLGPGGNVVLGDGWLNGTPPATTEPEFSSREYDGVTYRIVSQRVSTLGGEWVLRLADGSDPRQQWLRQMWVRVVLPNTVLVVAAIFAVNWAVRRAFRPLIELKRAVERRSPRDLSNIDVQSSPAEVRPLVQSLNRLFELVNAQAESQRRFVADAAHQLRTPLAAQQAQVEAWAQVVNQAGRADWRDRAALRHDSGQAPVLAEVQVSAEQILKLRDATRRTSQLVNQLLALSRADARNADTASVQRVDLRALCEIMLECHLDAATAKAIDLGLEVQEAHAWGQEWLLRELLSNLVDNAIKYTPTGGRVTLRSGVELGTGFSDGTVHPFLEVEDNGPGVPVAERAKVLERFYRIPGTAGEGTGLGLAIAAEVARVHHTQLQVLDARSGQGLRMRLELKD